MPFDLYSKRQKRLRGEVSDVFVYDEIPKPLRVQIVHIWNDAFGRDTSDSTIPVANLFKSMRRILATEYGEFYLVEPYTDAREDMEKFLLNCPDAEKALDTIELSFLAIIKQTREHNYRMYARPRMEPAEAVEELNIRFREHGLGYQFENGSIIRVDSTHLHNEVTKPALLLLNDPLYEGADDEFRSAHEHHLHGRTKEALSDALKAFESTMKVICKKRQWTLDGRETAKDLIKICGDNGLFPSYLENHYNALRTTLESGVPVVRNKLGGHGQGQQVVSVPAYFAAYSLNLAAATISLPNRIRESAPVTARAEQCRHYLFVLLPTSRPGLPHLLCDQSSRCCTHDSLAPKTGPSCGSRRCASSQNCNRAF
jgi:hypothetical protein